LQYPECGLKLLDSRCMIQIEKPIDLLFVNPHSAREFSFSDPGQAERRIKFRLWRNPSLTGARS
jgi:hypothetical protein